MHVRRTSTELLRAHLRRLAPALLLPALACPAARAVTNDVIAARTRVYYIAADEVPWDYDPGGRDEIAGRP